MPRTSKATRAPQVDLTQAEKAAPKAQLVSDQEADKENQGRNASSKKSSPACFTDNKANEKRGRKRKSSTADDQSRNDKPASTKKRKDSVTSTTVHDVHLQGEEHDAVEIYDTCDEMRRKINAYLRKDGATQAQLCRDMYAMYRTPKVSKISSSQLQSFLKKKGARSGCTSAVFYAAYVYFEKLRIAEGKPKNKHRLEMEKIYGGKGGLDDLETDGSNRFVTVMKGQSPYEDQFGRRGIA